MSSHSGLLFVINVNISSKYITISIEISTVHELVDLFFSLLLMYGNHEVSCSYLSNMLVCSLCLLKYMLNGFELQAMRLKLF